MQFFKLTARLAPTKVLLTSVYFITFMTILAACSNTPIIEEKVSTKIPARKPCPCEEVRKGEEIKKVAPVPTEEKKSADLPNTQPNTQAKTQEISRPTEVKPAETKPIEAKLADYSLLKSATWDDTDGFTQENLSVSWPAWRQSCVALRNKVAWQNVCTMADSIDVQFSGKPNDATIYAYFKTYFSVYQATNADGSDTGLVTGYYEPMLKGSRFPSKIYPFPLYSAPSDLITVALDDLYPELKYKRIRGRLVNNKLVPYYNRADIEAENSPIARHAFVYVSDKIDLFFLQIQGSGLITFENGEQMHVGYADQNGHAYQSIGKLLIANGELNASEASMQGIKNWAVKNPSKLQALLNQNPSYVFFRELPADLPGPIGALGVPLLSEQALAVDAKFIPLGAPVFLSSTMPNSTQPLKKLMMAQDTGGAIKGGVRADFYWGSGFEAGEKAGAMKQSGKIWVLLPNDFKLPNAPN